MIEWKKNWRIINHKRNGIVHTEYNDIANVLRLYYEEKELEPINIKLTKGNREVKFFRFKINNVWRIYEIMDDYFISIY